MTPAKRLYALLCKVAAGRAEGLRFRVAVASAPARYEVRVFAGPATALRKLVDGTFFEGLPVTVVRRSR